MGICMAIYTYICARLCRSHRYKPVDSGVHIGVAMGYRIPGAGCRVRVQGEIVMLKVYVELQESMTAPSPRSTPNTTTRRGLIMVTVRVRRVVSQRPPLIQLRPCLALHDLGIALHHDLLQALRAPLEQQSCLRKLRSVCPCS